MPHALQNQKQSPPPLSVGKNALWNTAGSFFYQGCQWLLTVIVVWLSNGYENAGFLAYAMTIGNIFAPIALYGTRVYQVSDVNNKYKQNNYVAFRLITSLIGAVIAIAYAVAITPSLQALVIVLIYLIFKADETFVSVCYAIDQTSYRMDYIGISQIMRGFGSLLGFTLGLYLTHDLIAAILAMFALCFIVTLLYDLPHSHRFGPIRPAINKDQAFALLKECLPVMAANVLCGLVVSITRQYFSIGSGTEALGIYASVATPSVVIQALAQYIYSPALTPLAERWQNNDGAGFKRALFKTLGAMIGICVIGTVVLSLAGAPLLLLFYGQSITDYTYLFPWVLVGSCFIALLWFSMDVLVSIRNIKDALIANVISVICALVIMVPMIDAFYMNGINFTIIFAMCLGLAYAGVKLFMHIKKQFNE